MKATDPLYRRMAADDASVMVMGTELATKVGTSMHHHQNNVVHR
jgi:hypothetical protein